MNATARFALFPYLPPELRIQIWQDALPEIRPALYSYRPGCWRPILLTKPDYYYLPSYHVLEFCHDRLGGTRLNIALVSVNREARHVALDWAAENDVEILREGDSEVLVRQFEPESDCMYVSPDDWHVFLAEQAKVSFELGWDQLFWGFSIRSEVTRLAVPEAIFELHDANWRQLGDLLSSFLAVEEVYVISGRLSDLPSPGGHGDLPWRCEIGFLQGQEVLWDPENKTLLPRHGVEGTQTQLCDEVVQQASQEIYQELVDTSWGKSFRICKVYLLK